jgi:Protein of unknown function (DUF1203)
MSFRVHPISPAVADVVRLSHDDGYGNTDLRPIVVKGPNDAPCRVCLRMADVGDEVLLFSYSPFDRPRPYRNVGPIFTHVKGCVPHDPVQGVPALLRTRFLSIRGYDADDTMVVADAVEGTRLEETVDRFFADRRVTTIHVHNARPGCFLCRIDRA